MSSGEAFVTLATNDSYALGALVLANSLRQAGTTRQLAIMITSAVSEPLRNQIEGVFDSVSFVDVLNSNDTENLQLLTRPDLGVTFTKLHCWRLTQYSKCVFLDADTLVLQNIDDLFERDEFSAAPDVGWPDCFNSGVFVYRPSLDTYRALLSFAVTHGSFDGGDQGLLNLFFSNWASKDVSKRLPFVYNVVSQAFYSYQPAYKRFSKDVKVVHFIGSTKPWHLSYNMATNSVEAYGDQSHCYDFLQLWWSVFINTVKPALQSGSVTYCGEVCRLNIFSPQQLIDDHRQYSWEKGQVDYMGIDAFANIQRQLDAKLHEPKPSPQQPAKPVHPQSAPSAQAAAAQVPTQAATQSASQPLSGPSACPPAQAMPPNATQVQVPIPQGFVPVVPAGQPASQVVIQPGAIPVAAAGPQVQVAGPQVTMPGMPQAQVVRQIVPQAVPSVQVGTGQQPAPQGARAPQPGAAKSSSITISSGVKQPEKK